MGLTLRPSSVLPQFRRWAVEPKTFPGFTRRSGWACPALPVQRMRLMVKNVTWKLLTIIPSVLILPSGWPKKMTGTLPLTSCWQHLLPWFPLAMERTTFLITSPLSRRRPPSLTLVDLFDRATRMPNFLPLKIPRTRTTTCGKNEPMNLGMMMLTIPECSCTRPRVHGPGWQPTPLVTLSISCPALGPMLERLVKVCEIADPDTFRVRVRLPTAVRPTTLSPPM